VVYFLSGHPVYCVLFSCRVRVRVTSGIRFSVWLVQWLCTRIWNAFRCH